MKQILSTKKEYDKNWRESHKKYVDIKHKEWRDNNKEHVRAKGRATMKKYRKDCRLTVFRFYSNGTMCCKCCGISNYEFLCIDHINGGGKKDRENPQKSGSGLYPWIIRNNFPDGFQILCHNCNMAKGFYGQCPHIKLLN